MTVSAATEPPRIRRAVARRAGLGVALAVLAFAALLSLAVGARSISLADVVDALLHGGSSQDVAIVRDIRVPRTLLGIVVGAAIGVAGALMQALTRNPLADPGLLGVEAGASAAVVIAIGWLGLTQPRAYVWFAFAGAAVASVVVYVLGSRGRAGATPVRLALAGTAVAAALTAFTYGITLLDPEAFDEFRFWQVGSLVGRDMTILGEVGPFLLAGLVLTLALARPLNALALGEDAGRALGARIGRTRALGAIAITLLCGGATAVAGPIAFIGLMIPHLARAIAGPDQRWVLGYSLLLAPMLLVGADVIGRVLVRPGELEVGIITALVGAPVFIALVRRTRIAQL
jgi:iron complex transport system permease protein